jgi:hypothetical protein
MAKSNLYQVSSKLLREGSLLDRDFKTEVLEVLIDAYMAGIDFYENNLFNSDTDLDFISKDLNNLTSYLGNIGMAKSISKTSFEFFLSIEDDRWRKNNLDDYKQSSKSSTIHVNNLKGLPNVHPWNQIFTLLETLYNDMSRKFEGLRSIASNRKFEIEKELVEYTIRKKITE